MKTFQEKCNKEQCIVEQEEAEKQGIDPQDLITEAIPEKMED